jgi:quinohemoprotein ethanol dehydrogenase
MSGRAGRGGILIAAALAAAGCSAPDKAPSPTNPADWPGYSGHGEQHYSPLDQINAGNVSRLGLAWSYDIETGPNAYTAPIAVGGVFYFAAGYSVVHALDATTGRLLWRYDPKAPRAAGDKLRASWGSRGIAYANGKIFTGTTDGRLIALSASTGKVLWSVQTIDAADGSYITGPPWIAGDKVLIGFGGADFAPVRGYVTAYDIDTGQQEWRFWTVPGNPAAGFENKAMEMAAKTWTGEWWKYGGGGTVWNAMAYDPKLNLVYVGTGNGAPWNQKIRSPGGGDNLFLCSIIAINADTGEYVWHYQVNPAETWDYNAAMEILLADMKVGGEVRPVILHAPKNGFFYVIDRATGKLISAEKFVKNVTWAERIDLASGRPVEVAEARFPDGKPVIVWPSPVGAHAAEAMAHNPRTGLTYIPAVEQGRVYVDPPSLKDWRFQEGQFINNGIGVPPAEMVVPPGGNFLLAWNPATQKAAWSVPLVGAKNGGLLTTGGNLVVQGNVTGEVAIYAGDTGRKIWSFDAQTGILAQPISYAVNGRQYISVMVSWRGIGPSGHTPEWEYRTQKKRVLTFALDGRQTLPPTGNMVTPIVDDPSFRIDPARAEAGKPLFARHCALCHGPQGLSGGAAPDLRKAGTPLDAQTFASIVGGGMLVDNGMPRFAELSAGQLAALQHYIRGQARVALAGKQPENVRAIR